jgi:hypothetical protein
MPRQPLQDAGERTGMNVENVSQLACRHARKQPHDPHHQPLRSRDPYLGRHPLGRTFERVHHCPQLAHELENVR